VTEICTFKPFPAAAIAVTGISVCCLLRAQAPVGVAKGFRHVIEDNGRPIAVLSGTSVRPVEGAGLQQMRVEALRVETFDKNGTPELVADAPECLLDLSNKTNKLISSNGPIHVRHVAGLYRVSGVGFLWNQGNGRLTISNQAFTAVRMTASTPFRP